MFKKGKSGNPNGRPQGAKDKAQADIKEAYKSLVEGNLNNIEQWLKTVADKDPGRAIELLLRLSEFVLPKIKAIQLETEDNKHIILYQNVSKQFPDR